MDHEATQACRKQTALLKTPTSAPHTIVSTPNPCSSIIDTKTIEREEEEQRNEVRGKRIEEQKNRPKRRQKKQRSRREMKNADAGRRTSRNWKPNSRKRSAGTDGRTRSRGKKTHHRRSLVEAALTGHSSLVIRRVESNWPEGSRSRFRSKATHSTCALTSSISQVKRRERFRLCHS